MKIEIKVTMNDRENGKLKELETAIGSSIKVPNVKGKWGYHKNGNIFIAEQCLSDAVDIIVAISHKIKSLFKFLEAFIPTVKMAGKAFNQNWLNDTTEVEPLPDHLKQSEQEKSNVKVEPEDSSSKIETKKESKDSPKGESKYIPSKSKTKK